MPEHLLDLYVSREDADVAGEWGRTIRSAVTQLTGQGICVHYGGTIFVPAEETCFALFAADSADAVREVARLASFPSDHVSPAFSQP